MAVVSSGEEMGASQCTGPETGPGLDNTDRISCRIGRGPDQLRLFVLHQLVPGSREEGAWKSAQTIICKAEKRSTFIGRHVIFIRLKASLFIFFSLPHFSSPFRFFLPQITDDRC